MTMTARMKVMIIAQTLISKKSTNGASERVHTDLNDHAAISAVPAVVAVAHGSLVGVVITTGTVVVAEVTSLDGTL